MGKQNYLRKCQELGENETWVFRCPSRRLKQQAKNERVKPLVIHHDGISKRLKLEKTLTLLCFIFLMKWHTRHGSGESKQTWGFLTVERTPHKRLQQFYGPWGQRKRGEDSKWKSTGHWVGGGKRASSGFLPLSSYSETSAEAPKKDLCPRPQIKM